MWYVGYHIVKKKKGCVEWMFLTSGVQLIEWCLYEGASPQYNILFIIIWWLLLYAQNRVEMIPQGWWFLTVFFFFLTVQKSRNLNNRSVSPSSLGFLLFLSPTEIHELSKVTRSSPFLSFPILCFVELAPVSFSVVFIFLILCSFKNSFFQNECQAAGLC